MPRDKAEADGIHSTTKTQDRDEDEDKSERRKDGKKIKTMST